MKRDPRQNQEWLRRHPEHIGCLGCSACTTVEAFWPKPQREPTCGGDGCAQAKGCRNCLAGQPCPSCGEPYRDAPGGVSCTHLPHCDLPIYRAEVAAREAEEPTVEALFDELATVGGALAGAEGDATFWSTKLTEADKELSRANKDRVKWKRRAQELALQLSKRLA